MSNKYNKKDVNKANIKNVNKLEVIYHQIILNDFLNMYEYKNEKIIIKMKKNIISKKYHPKLKFWKILKIDEIFKNENICSKKIIGNTETTPAKIPIINLCLFNLSQSI